MELRSAIDAPRFGQGGDAQASRRAFTIPEVIVGVALLAVFLLMCVGILRAAKRLLPASAIELSGEVVPMAPSPAAFADAVKLHGAFLERLSSARAVYVFGGTHEGLPAGASRLRGAPLSSAALPIISDFSRGLPQDAYAFYQSYSEQLGPPAAGSRPGDFTVLLVGPSEGKLAITTLVQVRERNVTLEDQETPAAWVRRDTVLYDLYGDSWTCAFVEKAEVATADAIGARHFWYRYDEGRVAEEGPVVAVFPDPWLFAGSRPTAREQTPPFSRFTYVLSVNP